MTSRAVNPSAAPTCTKFKKTVIIGYTDVAAAGCRALLSCVSVRIYESLDVPEVATLPPSCSQPNAERILEQQFHPLQVIHSKYNEFSLVIVNCVLPGNKCHYVANKIIDLCISSKVEKLIILSALRLDIVLPNPVYENSLNGNRETRREPLPLDTKTSDPFLSTLLQMIQIEELPCSLFVTVAHRASEGTANTEDGSEQAILRFHDVLRKWHKLGFEKEYSLSMVFRLPPSNADRLMFG